VSEEGGREGGRGGADTELKTKTPHVNVGNYGKSPFLMGKSTISMAIFNSYVSLPEGKLIYTFK